jgi:hypothetical protein
MNRSEIEAIIKDATGNPDSGAVHDWTPIIADALDAAMNPKPETNTKPKAKQETRIMDPNAAEKRETT